MSPVPVLPGLFWMDAARHLLWAAVLFWLLLVLVHCLRLPVPRRWVLLPAGLAVAWALTPGPLSASYWLGLAFQSPSLMTGLLCVLGSVRALRVAWKPAVAQATAPEAGMFWLSMAGVLLGWVLLLDTLGLTHGLLPASIYAWGFGPVALWCQLALALLLWGAGQRASAALLLAVAGVFALSRLPSGNLWDALLDPWLWLLLHARVLRRCRVQARASKSA